MKTVANSHADPASSCAKSALLMVISFRFDVFKSAFGRLPKPDEPLFFDSEKAKKPTKASPALAIAQVEAAATAMGIKAAPVLKLLKFAPKAAPRAATANRSSGWERFKSNHLLHQSHGISPAELEALAGLAMHGSATSAPDFLFMLSVIRKQSQS